MFTLWCLTFLGEGLLYVVPLVWRYRRIISALLGVAIIITTATLLRQVDSGVWVLLAVLGMYRVSNLLRIIKSRMHEQYLHQAVRHTSLWLFVLHPLLLAAILLPISFAANGFWYILAIVQVLVALVILVTVIKNIRKLKFEMPAVFLTDRELPTVTVAIPARNETTDLEACLQSVLANDYPKLEVLVLDDCSQSATAEIIRSFAHEGVRFIQGTEPAERWLAKNQAYEKLYQEATGDIMLFCGVDARFGPQAFRSMVNLMAARQKFMLSVLPIRTYSSFASAFVQSMRYWWELALPRRLFNKPAVLSTCWLIGRQELKKLGGFGAVCHTILPERYFAREMVKTDQYSFVRSSAELQVETVKNFHEQYATALRTKYPQLRRRPEDMLMLTILTLLFLLGPFVGLVVGLGSSTSIILPLVACLLLIVAHVAIVSITDPANSLLASITFPLAVLTDVYIMYGSMIRYEFFAVAWKDRNICIPVMHVIPKLPAIPEN